MAAVTETVDTPKRAAISDWAMGTLSVAVSGGAAVSMAAFLGVEADADADLRRIDCDAKREAEEHRLDW